MNRQKTIKKLIRKLKRVIRLYADARDGVLRPEAPVLEQSQLEAMIRAAVETDWKP